MECMWKILLGPWKPFGAPWQHPCHTSGAFGRPWVALGGGGAPLDRPGRSLDSGKPSGAHGKPSQRPCHTLGAFGGPWGALGSVGGAFGWLGRAFGRPLLGLRALATPWALLDGLGTPLARPWGTLDNPTGRRRKVVVRAKWQSWQAARRRRASRAPAAPQRRASCAWGAPEGAVRRQCARATCIRRAIALPAAHDRRAGGAPCVGARAASTSGVRLAHGRMASWRGRGARASCEQRTGGAQAVGRVAPERHLRCRRGRRRRAGAVQTLRPSAAQMGERGRTSRGDISYFRRRARSVAVGCGALERQHRPPFLAHETHICRERRSPLFWPRGPKEWHTVFAGALHRTAPRRRCVGPAREPAARAALLGSWPRPEAVGSV